MSEVRRGEMESVSSAPAVREMQEKRAVLLVQVLRAVAALMVLWLHVTALERDKFDPGYDTWHLGNAGVDIFFVISGFVMGGSARSLHGTARPVRTFLARRAERVVPLYWLATTAKLVLTLALPALAVGALGGVWHVVASYLFLPSYSVGTLPYPILAPGWTLNYEMFFYLLVAIGLGLRLRIVPYVSVVLAVLGVLGFFRPEGFPAICSLVDPLLLEFMYGILLVVLLPRLRSEKVWQKVVAGVAFVSGFGLMALHVGENYRPERALIWGVPAMLIVGSALALEESVGRHVPRWLLVLGDGSYSLYLSHVLVLAALGSVLQRHHEIGRRSRVAEELLVALVCVAGGMITYRLVEKPIMSYFKGRRKRAVPVVV